jgi:hypothetical protein
VGIDRTFGIHATACFHLTALGLGWKFSSLSTKRRETRRDFENPPKPPGSTGQRGRKNLYSPVDRLLK